MPNLFDPLQFGPHALSHRVVLAPLTRMRAFDEATPTEMMAEYYSQRASNGGLLISEATVISRDGFPHEDVPAAYTPAQIGAWKVVTDAVHAKGGVIYLQLWHAGRASHPFLQPDNAQPAGPSAILAEGGARKSGGTPVPFEMPRALETEEVAGVVASYAKATQNALDAGFDGVEVHCANGYLPDQFLNDGSNHRTDKYGGSIENRARFTLEVVEACADVIGMDRVGARISPQNPYNGMSDSNPEATFRYLARALNEVRLGYLHVIEPRVRGNDDFEKGAPVVASRMLRQEFSGTLMAAGGFTKENADELIGDGGADLVAFGRLFIANPDLPERFRNGLELNAYDRATFYGGDERGYTDYPFAETA